MKNLLLDTHAFIWLTEDDENLPKSLKEIIEKADNVYVSIVSLWEIAIKLNIGKISLKKDYSIIGKEIQNSDIILLPISFQDTLTIFNLPLYHRDPFDRMLIAQAMNNSFILVSKDEAFNMYSITKLWE